MTDIFPTEIEAIAAYEERLKPHRDRFGARTSVATLEHGTDLPGELLQLFMIHYAAYGISMTYPVEDWIHRAGTRCRETNYETLGVSLIKHASHEAGHHRMMVSDLWTLVDAWNQDHPDKIDPIALSRRDLPASIELYRELHEKVIAGDAPYAQIALEYEIEALSIRYGPSLLALAGKEGAVDGCSFLAEHVALDSAHTQFNQKQIADLLINHPECLESLVGTGAAALDIYGQFIDDCVAATLAYGNGASDYVVSCRLLEPPVISDGEVPEWLIGTRSIRSRILYDDGARPAFGPGGSAYGDADPLDLHCHHLLLLNGEIPVGAGRLTAPGTNAAPSLVDSAFGRKNVLKSLSRMGIRRAACAEASRLVVDPDYRNGFSPRILFAGLWALAAELNANTIIAAVGTVNGQDRMFSILGAKMLDEVGYADAPMFNDTLRLAYFIIEPDAPPNYPELDHMREFVKRSLRNTPSELTT
jgi:hypothetical protein